MRLTLPCFGRRRRLSLLWGIAITTWLTRVRGEGLSAKQGGLSLKMPRYGQLRFARLRIQTRWRWTATTTSPRPGLNPSSGQPKRCTGRGCPARDPAAGTWLPIIGRPRGGVTPCRRCHGQVNHRDGSCWHCGHGPDARRRPTPAELAEVEIELSHHRPGGLVDTRDANAA